MYNWVSCTMTFNDRISYRALTAFLAQFANARNHVRPGFEELLFRQTKLVSAGYVLSNTCSWRSVASVAHTVSQWPIKTHVIVSKMQHREDKTQLTVHRVSLMHIVHVRTVRQDKTRCNVLSLNRKNYNGSLMQNIYCHWRVATAH